MDKIGDYEINSPRWLSLEDFEGEVWKPIEGCETHQVSNYGRVKSLERRIKSKGDSTSHRKACILRVRLYLGYPKVSLLLNGKTMLVSVHRLVAKAFVANPNNYPIINHKNEIKHDNRALNLEWCTTKYNVNYGTGRNRSAMKKIETHGKRICQYTKDGDLVMKYLSVTVASKQNGYNPREIWKACKGKSHTYKGYVWRYERDAFDKYPINIDYSKRKKKQCRPIAKYSTDGTLIRIYEGGMREIRQEYENDSSIYGCLYGGTHTAYGYIWRYKDQIPPDPIPLKRKIVQYSLDYELIAVHDSLSDAARFVNSRHMTPISNCLQGRSITSLGFIWKYEDEGKPCFRKINQMSLDGSFIRQYRTIGEVLREFGQKKMSSISQCINGNSQSAFGYKWSYEKGED